MGPVSSVRPRKRYLAFLSRNPRRALNTRKTSRRLVFRVFTASESEMSCVLVVFSSKSGPDASAAGKFEILQTFASILKLCLLTNFHRLSFLPFTGDVPNLVKTKVLNTELRRASTPTRRCSGSGPVLVYSLGTELSQPSSQP